MGCVISVAIPECMGLFSSNDSRMDVPDNWISIIIPEVGCEPSVIIPEWGVYVCMYICICMVVKVHPCMVHASH